MPQMNLQNLNNQEEMLKNTDFYTSIKETIMKKLQTDDKKSLLEHEAILLQFLKTSENHFSSEFDSKRDWELFQLVADLFMISFEKENDDLPYRVNIVKNINSKIPDFNFIDVIKPAPKFQILRRRNTSEPEIQASTNFVALPTEDTIEKLKEREESYNKARAIIFGDFVEDDTEEQESLICPVPEQKPKEVQPNMSAVQWDGGHPAHEYYNDSSAFIRSRRPQASHYVRNDYPYFPQQQFYPPPVTRTTQNPQIYRQPYVPDQQLPFGVLPVSYPGYYPGPFPLTYPYANMTYRPDYYNPGYPYFPPGPYDDQNVKTEHYPPTSRHSSKNN